MKKFYHEENEIGFIGIDKEDFIKNMYEWSNDDEITHLMFTGIWPGNYETLEQTYTNLVKGDNVVFAIVDKKNDKIIGICGLYGIQWQPRFAEYRILIGNKAYWGKGIGTMAATFILKYAFRKLNLNKVHLGVNVENKGAVKSYEKAGFKHEGIVRQEIYRNGRYYDAHKMSVLREEWNN
ncbi:MAG: GNAT family protein [Nanoarchaeota archaeon]